MTGHHRRWFDVAVSAFGTSVKLVSLCRPEMQFGMLGRVGPENV